MNDETVELVKALLETSGMLQKEAEQPRFSIRKQDIVVLSPTQVRALAMLLERAADALMKGEQGAA